MTVECDRIRYLSRPADVSMADAWYEIADLNHFWVVRRFEVLRRLADGLIQGATAVADVGCGHGLLQRQLENAYNKPITGFDLNETALKQTLSRLSPVLCYDLFDKNPEFTGHFELIFLFDVLEHIRDEDSFVDALLAHLAPAGKVVINVPAFQSLFSAYDRAAGHVRRYDISSLRGLAKRHDLIVTRFSYWGLPLLPLLAVRKVWLSIARNEHTIAAGFDSRGKVMNWLLLQLSRCESAPQERFGTSVMAILERADHG